MVLLIFIETGFENKDIRRLGTSLLIRSFSRKFILNPAIS